MTLYIFKMSGIRNFNVNHIYYFLLIYKSAFMSLFAYGKGQNFRKKKYAVFSLGHLELYRVVGGRPLSFLFDLFTAFSFCKSTRRGTEAGGKARFCRLRLLLVF